MTEFFDQKWAWLCVKELKPTKTCRTWKVMDRHGISMGEIHWRSHYFTIDLCIAQGDEFKDLANVFAYLTGLIGVKP